MLWGTEKEVIKNFGEAGKPVCASGKITLPFPMKLSWDKSTLIHKISCHELVAASAQRVINKIAILYSPEDIEKHGFNIFGGGYNFRNKRGSMKTSMHAFGIAFDFDPERNQLRWGKDKSYLAKPECEKFWECWEEEGWTSLGRNKNYDWMHVQAPFI